MRICMEGQNRGHTWEYRSKPSVWGHGIRRIQSASVMKHCKAVLGPLEFEAIYFCRTGFTQGLSSSRRGED
jgi:hypothetical protein